MRILFLASGAVAVPALRWLTNSCHEVVAVVTQPDRPAGRGRRPEPTPVKRHAAGAGLQVIQADNVNDPAVVAKLLNYRPDLGVTASFGQMIASVLLRGIPGGCLNIHPSLLPKYRGAAPVNWAIIHGETQTGVTIIRLVEQMDAGPILSVRETMIKPCETAGELSDRLAGIACDALDAALQQFSPGLRPPGRPQDDAQATPAPKLTKDMGQIDLNQPAEQIVAWVNGLSPWPAVQLDYVPKDGRPRTRVRLMRAALAGDPRTANARCGQPSPTEPPGTLLDDGTIACPDGAVRVSEIQPAGGRVMSWQDFVNGRRVQPGDRFEGVTTAPQG